MADSPAAGTCKKPPCQHFHNGNSRVLAVTAFNGESEKGGTVDIPDSQEGRHVLEHEDHVVATSQQQVEEVKVVEEVEEKESGGPIDQTYYVYETLDWDEIPLGKCYTQCDFKSFNN